MPDTPRPSGGEPLAWLVQAKAAAKSKTVSRDVLAHFLRCALAELDRLAASAPRAEPTGGEPLALEQVRQELERLRQAYFDSTRFPHCRPEDEKSALRTVTALAVAIDCLNASGARPAASPEEPTS